MKEQPHYTNLLTVEFFTEHYNKQRKSFPQITEMLRSDGHVISVGTVHKYAKALGFGRTVSEGCRNFDPNPLDFTNSYMDERTIESIDGFLLGDGHLDGQCQNAARVKCGVQYKEFAEYLMLPFVAYNTSINGYLSDSMSSGTVWDGHSYSHPDIHKQMQRWYPDGGKKQPPDDVRITPTSVMMWYLGDGSLVVDNEVNTVMLRLSTDGFLPERVEFLARRLKEVAGIECHRNGDNRIFIDAKGVPAFFDFIGRKSPVACYDYKFELPEWRLTSKRMKEVADELSVNYNRLSHLVKVGKVPCMRLTPKGKPRFLPEHVRYISGHAVLLGL